MACKWLEYILIYLVCIVMSCEVQCVFIEHDRNVIEQS